MNKFCKKCQTDKDYCEFGSKKRNPDGLQGMCKECRSKFDNLTRLNRGTRKKSILLVQDNKVKQPKKKYVKKAKRNDHLRGRPAQPSPREMLPQNEEDFNAREYGTKEAQSPLMHDPIIIHLVSVCQNLLARVNEIEQQLTKKENVKVQNKHGN